LVVVGHNPVFTELANLFLSEYIPNIPTSGLVSLFFDVKEWAIVDKVPVDHKIYMPKKG